jgi:hypothetical protein
MFQKIQMPISILGAGSIIYIDYPYEEKNVFKRRPAVVLSYSSKTTKVVMLKISSVDKYNDVNKYPYAYKIKDLDISGLPKPSYVLTDKELIVPNDTNCEGVGRLSERDLKNVNILHNKAVLDRKNISQMYEED